jgi:hypothetical protein
VKYTITRQFLVPHYQHIIVEAVSVEEACQIALGEHPTIEVDWCYCEGVAAEVKEDFDNSRETEIERIVAGEWRDRAGDPNPYSDPSRPELGEPTLLPIPGEGFYTTEGGDHDERLRTTDSPPAYTENTGMTLHEIFHRIFWHFKRRRHRLGVALRYVAGRLTPDDAAYLRYECQQIEGSWTLLSIDAAGIAHVFRDLPRDHRALRRLAVDTMAYIARNWCGDLTTLESCAFNVIRHRANDERVNLPNEGAATDHAFLAEHDHAIPKESE